MARTPEERSELLDTLRLDINNVYDEYGQFDHIEITSGEFHSFQTVYCGKLDNFQTLNEALDYIIDCREWGKEFYRD